MKITTEQVKETARTVAGQVRVAGRKARARLIEVRDAALVEAGRRAKARQRGRAAKRVLKTAGRAALVAGVTAAAAMATRAAVRNARSARGARGKKGA